MVGVRLKMLKMRYRMTPEMQHGRRCGLVMWLLR
jgi:hypothetical protein